MRLHEKGGRRHDVPAHHRAAVALDAYVEAGGLGEPKAALFQTVDPAARRLTGQALYRRLVVAMIEGGWGSVEALESAVELMRKRGVRRGGFWRWTSWDDEQDADPTLWEPVKRRGAGYVYTRVRDVMRRLYTPFTDDPIQPGVTPVKGHPLHGVASPDRRSAGSGGVAGLLVDRPGAESRGDPHQARASARAPEGAG